MSALVLSSSNAVTMMSEVLKSMISEEEDDEGSLTYAFIFVIPV